MIEATYTLEEPEYLEAHAILARTVQKGLFRIRIWLPVILVFSLLGVSFHSGFTLREFLDPRLIFVVLFIPFLIFYPWISRRAARKQYANKIRDSFTNFHLRLDNEGYKGESPGLSSGHIYWKAFTGWKEGKTVFVLFRNNMMYPIPKSPFSEAELNELRELLAANIAPALKPK